MSPLPSSPPFALRFAAVVCLMFGTVAIVDTVAAFLTGRFYINFAFVGIFVGRGLLAGSRAARRWALFLFGLMLASVIVLGGWQLISGGFRSLTAAFPDHYGLLYIAGAMLAVAVVFAGLCTPSVRAWCSRGTEDDGGTGVQDRSSGLPRLTMPIILATAFLAAGHAWSDHHTLSIQEQTFPVQTTIEFRDARAPDRPVGSMSVHVDTRERSGRLEPRVSTSTSVNAGGIIIGLQGISTRPVKVTFKSPGYQPYVYTLTEKSPRSETLLLQPES